MARAGRARESALEAKAHSPPRALHPRFRPERPALVLTGGGAMGAYEVGVLRAFEAVGLTPKILAGVSVGAVNAMLWIAYEFRTEPLRQIWLALRSSSIGLLWATLMLRAAGVLIALFAILEMALTLASAQELSISRMLWHRVSQEAEVSSVLLDAALWGALAIVGLLVIGAADRADTLVARWTAAPDPVRRHRLLGGVLLAGALVHLVIWGTGLAWPYRFSATLLVVGAALWFVTRPDRQTDWIRTLALKLSPETGGRGLWGAEPRRRLIRRLIGEGNPSRVTKGDTHLIMSACDMNSGRMCYFVNWSPVDPRFREHIEQRLGEVAEVRTVSEIIEAAVASSAIPGVFKPVRLRGRDFFDGGVFSNQPVHAVLADGADALVVVLVSPSAGPQRSTRHVSLFEMGGLLLELANWRDLQTELRSLPPDWTRTASRDARGNVTAPARVCVVEPDSALPGGLYGFGGANATELMRRGEADAWLALERAGWLAPGSQPPPPPASEPPVIASRGTLDGRDNARMEAAGGPPA